MQCNAAMPHVLRSSEFRFEHVILAPFCLIQGGFELAKELEIVLLSKPLLQYSAGCS